MVTRGQFLERPTVFPSGDRILEALSHRGDKCPPLLIVPPPPAQGGSMDHVLGAELAWAASQGGHSTLRFNFSGVGASQGEPGTLEQLAQDAAAALEVLRENTAASRVAVAALGGSLAVARLLVSSGRGVCGIALVDPAGDELEKLSNLGCTLLVVATPRHADDRVRSIARLVSDAGGTLELADDGDGGLVRAPAFAGHAVARWLDQAFVP